MIEIDAQFLLHLDRLQYPDRHTPDILLGDENAARHYAADLAEAASAIQRRLLTPIPVFPEFDAERAHEVAGDTHLAALAAKAAIASNRLILLTGQDPATVITATARQGGSGWLHPVAAVLSVVTGHVVAVQSQILDLLSDMVGVEITMGSQLMQEVADACADSLGRQFRGPINEALSRYADAASAAPVDAGGVADVDERPRWITDFVRQMGALFDSVPWIQVVYDSNDEPFVLVTPLTINEISDALSEQLDQLAERAGGTQPPA